MTSTPKRLLAAGLLAALAASAASAEGKVAVERQSSGVAPTRDDIVAARQKLADTFFQLGLIPKAIRISDPIRRPRS
jgi:sulfonate transport system substrate-binding protein